MDKTQENVIKLWDDIYKEYEKGSSIGNEYPREHLVRFVSNLRKDNSIEGYFNDQGEEQSISKNFEGKALEIGFGSTANLRMLRDKGFESYGLEVSEEAVIHGRIDLENREINDIKLDLWKPYKLPYKDESFKIVCGLQCIYYNLNLEEVIEEIHRILLPGGVFMFSFFSSKHDYMKYIEWTSGGYARWSDNHPNQRIRGCLLRQPKSEEELLKLFDVFSDLKVLDRKSVV